MEGNDSRERRGRKREVARTCGADSEPEWRRAGFLMRLASGENLILEVKGQDLEQDQVKRRFLEEWVKSR